MKHTTVYTTDEESTNKEIILNLKNGFEEMKLIEVDRLETTSLKNFINEV